MTAINTDKAKMNNGAMENTDKVIKSFKRNKSKASMPKEIGKYIFILFPPDLKWLSV